MTNNLAFDVTRGNDLQLPARAKPTKPDRAPHKLEKLLRRNVGRAIKDYNLIEEGDRIMVCVSGGKDSFTLLDILMRLRSRAPVSFDLLAVNLDQNQPGFPTAKLETYLANTGIDYRIVSRDTYSVVKRVIPEGKTMCGLCSRLRRGALYDIASREGMTKIALGHHMDDIVETLFLNMFYGAKLKAMPPKLLNDSGQHIVIRPLAYCRERDIARYAQALKFPLIPCDLCGSQSNLARQVIKKMLVNWEKDHPGRTANIFRSLTSIAPSQLADRELFDFVGLGTTAIPQPQWLPEGANQPRAGKC